VLIVYSIHSRFRLSIPVQFIDVLCVTRRRIITWLEIYRSIAINWNVADEVGDAWAALQDNKTTTRYGT